MGVVVGDCDGEGVCCYLCYLLVFVDCECAVCLEIVGDCGGCGGCVDGFNVGDCFVLEGGVEFGLDLGFWGDVDGVVFGAFLVVVGCYLAVGEFCVFDSFVGGVVLVFVEGGLVCVLGVDSFVCGGVDVVLGGCFECLFLGAVVCSGWG